MNEELMNLGVIITSLGESLIENSAISGVDLQLSQFSVGDGGGDAFNPTYDDLKALRVIPGEWDKRNLVEVYENPDGAGFVAEGLVPHNVGEGKWCRIAGYWTTSGELFAVHLIPAWPKPVNSGNMLIELPLKAYFAFSDQANISLVIDPTLVQATKDYVDRSLQVMAVVSNGLAKVGRRHLFLAHADVALPVAENGSRLSFMADFSVDLKAGKCRLTAPAGEKLITADGQFDRASIAVTRREFGFMRVNDAWRAE